MPWYHDYQDTSFCPTTPDPWTKWTFWQWTSSGTVSGISGNVDRNIFDGTLDDLRKITYNYEDICGDMYCGGDETYQNCPSDCLMMYFITPTDGAELMNPVLFKIEADSNITNVNYYADGYLFGTSSKPETGFAAEYTFNTLGERKILAEGFDKNGKRTGAASISIKVIPEPKCGDGECNGDENFVTCDADCVDIKFITPRNGESIHNPVTFRVSAPESVKRVIYYADIYKFATSDDAYSKFEVTYRFNVIGNRRIIAEAYDENQKQTGKTYIDITILEEQDSSIIDSESEDTAADIVTEDTPEDIPDITEDIIPQGDIQVADTVTDTGYKPKDTAPPDTSGVKTEDSSGCGCNILE